MKVNATLSKVEEVELSLKTQNEVMFKRFEEITGWKMPGGDYHGYTIRDGFVFEYYTEWFGRHSSFEYKEIRKATNADHAMFKVALTLINGANKK